VTTRTPNLNPKETVVKRHPYPPVPFPKPGRACRLLALLRAARDEARALRADALARATECADYCTDAWHLLHLLDCDRFEYTLNFFADNLRDHVPQCLAEKAWLRQRS
jgi:hypothetical protein